MIITDLWFIPSIFPGTKEELLERLLFIKEVFDKLMPPSSNLPHTKQKPLLYALCALGSRPFCSLMIDLSLHS
jgi:hypothetical protein